MILVCEILLTIQAWKRGWKALALLPMVIGLAAGMVFGVVAPDFVERMGMWLIVLDLGILAVLGVMCATGKSAQATPVPTFGAQPSEPQPTPWQPQENDNPYAVPRRTT